MSDFSTAAEVLFEPDENSLQDVREYVEDIGPVTVEVEPRNPVARDGGSRGRRGGGLGPSMTTGASASEPESVVGVLTESLEVQEAMLRHLDEINEDTDVLGLGAGGGDGGILSFLLDEGGDVGGSVVEELVGVLSDSASTAIGNAISDAVSDESIDVEEPDWTPIAVEDPGEVAVEDLPDEIDVDAPESIAVAAPESIPVDAPDAIDVDDPSPLAVDEPTLDVATEPLPVEDTTLPVETVDPLAVEEPTISVRVEGGRDSGSGGDGRTPGSDHSGEFGGGFSLGELGFEFGLATANGGDTGFRIDGGPNAGVNLGTGRFNSAPRNGSQPARVRDVSVTSRSDTRVTVDPSGLQDLRDEIVAAVEDSQERDLQELRSDLDDLQREFDRFTSDFTRGRRR